MTFPGRVSSSLFVDLYCPLTVRKDHSLNLGTIVNSYLHNVTMSQPQDTTNKPALACKNKKKLKIWTKIFDQSELTQD